MEYLEWYLSLPDKVLIMSERECLSYLYQMHAAAGILQSAGSEKAMEYSRKLDLYNRLIQGRLYGSVGMDAAEEVDEEEYEVSDELAADDTL